MSAIWGKNRLWLALLAVPVMFAACSHEIVQPPSLIVLQGAQDVHYCSVAGTQQVRYELKEEYPAKGTLKAIGNRLAKQGWRPVKEYSLDPRQPSSHVVGWTRFVDGRRKPWEKVQQWLGEWMNPEGNVVEYVLQYRSPWGKPANPDRLLVYGIYTPAKLAESRRPGGTR